MFLKAMVATYPFQVAISVAMVAKYAGPSQNLGDLQLCLKPFASKNILHLLFAIFKEPVYRTEYPKKF